MNRMKTTYFPIVLAVMVGMTISGCGSSGATEPPKTYRVQGKVIGQDGRPLSGGRVTFHPDEPRNSEAFAEIERDGTFALATFGKDDGAMPGKYKVSIDPYSYRDGQARFAARISSTYRDPRTSGLTAEIAGDTVLEPFRLR